MKKNLPMLALWALLIGAVGFSMMTQSSVLPDASARLSLLPKSQADFISRELPLTAAEAEVYQGILVVKKLCVFKGQQAQLLCLDGTRNRHAVHDPRLCFRGTGWEIIHEETMPHPAGGEVRHLRLSRGGQEIETVYWWSTVNGRHGSPSHYWFQTALRRITRGFSGDEPVLVVLQPLHAVSLNWSDWLSKDSPFQGL